MDGNQLNMNDNENDQEQLDALVSYAGMMSDYELQDAEVRLFTPYSKQKMADTFNGLGIGDIKNNISSLNSLSLLTGPPPLVSYLGYLGHSEFDFVEHLSFLSQETDNAYSPIQGGGATPPDGVGGFIRFEETNILYNIYDAGNFMTGKAFQMVDVKQEVLLKGANVSSKLTFQGPDTSADQKAVKDGFNYNGVIWTK